MFSTVQDQDSTLIFLLGSDLKYEHFLGDYLYFDLEALQQFALLLLQCVKKFVNIGDENIHTMSSSEIGPMLRISMLILTLVACPTITKKYNRKLVWVLKYVLTV